MSLRKARNEEESRLGEDRDDEEEGTRLPHRPGLPEFPAAGTGEEEGRQREEHDEMQHALVEDVFRDEGQLFPEVEERRDHEHPETKDTAGRWITAIAATTRTQPCHDSVQKVKAS